MAQTNFLEYLEYSETSPSGLVWKKKSNVYSKGNVGDVAGCKNPMGYWIMTVNGEKAYAHRVIANIFFEDFNESLEVDHIDNNPSNNKISNLRLATSSQNSHNVRGWGNKPSGLPKGICFVKSSTGEKYKAAVCKNRKIHQKYFKSLDEAIQWVTKTRSELHGEFAKSV